MTGHTKMPQGIRSHDPIPEKAISLSNAFDLFYRAVTNNWRELDGAIRTADEARGDKFIKKTDRPFFTVVKARELARGRAQIQFREALSSGVLQPMVRDPETGEHLVLSPQGWNQPRHDDDGRQDYRA